MLLSVVITVVEASMCGALICWLVKDFRRWLREVTQ